MRPTHPFGQFDLDERPFQPVNGGTGMAPGGVEPPHADSKSAALPLSYGAVLWISLTDASRVSRRGCEGWRRGLEPPTTGTTTRGSTN
jgi:hypothetical protein